MNKTKQQKLEARCMEKVNKNSGSGSGSGYGSCDGDGVIVLEN